MKRYLFVYRKRQKSKERKYVNNKKKKKKKKTLSTFEYKEVIYTWKTSTKAKLSIPHIHKLYYYIINNTLRLLYELSMTKEILIDSIGYALTKKRSII